MNKVHINGRLIKDPALKELENNNAVCTFFIANDVHFGANKKIGFNKVTAWGHHVCIIADHTATGLELSITGRLQQYRSRVHNDIYVNQHRTMPIGKTQDRGIKKYY